MWNLQNGRAALWIMNFFQYSHPYFIPWLQIEVLRLPNACSSEQIYSLFRVRVSADTLKNWYYFCIIARKQVFLCRNSSARRKSFLFNSLTILPIWVCSLDVENVSVLNYEKFIFSLACRFLMLARFSTKLYVCFCQSYGHVVLFAL